MDEFSYGYYQTMRLEARSAVVSAFNRKIRSSAHNAIWAGMELASMDSESIEYARLNWPKFYNGDTRQALPYSWEKLYMSYMRIPAHFNIAVWQTVEDRKILRGLALARPSHAKSHISVNWLERGYEEPHFKGGVLLPILASVEHYARLLECKSVLIKNAVDPNAFTKYGYTPFDDAPSGADYLGKEL
jgi:hypothetical protein